MASNSQRLRSSHTHEGVGSNLSDAVPARIGSKVCPGLSAVVVLGFAIRTYLQCRKPPTRDTSNSVLLLILAPLSALQGQQPGVPFPVATPKSRGVAAEAVRRVADDVHEYVRNRTVVGSVPWILKKQMVSWLNSVSGF